MTLGLDFSGLVIDDGRMVLAGRAGTGVKIEVGLLMTAMRLACEQVDPYFSLDPDDGGKWQTEGNKVSEEFYKLLQQTMRLDVKEWWRNVPDGLHFKSVSARRDYPQFWSGIAARYPNFKTRLVFKPEWLRETRYGEILYIGDIILKELSSGLSITNPKDQAVRALGVSNYRSARMRSSAERLLANVDGGQLESHGVTGSRFWFDLVPQARANKHSLFDEDVRVNPHYAPKTALGRALDANLKAMGLRDLRKPPDLLRHVSQSNNAIDLSNVYPSMFIVGHDHVSNEDVKANDLHELIVADAVNANIKHYVAAYSELQDLTDAFRAYIAAIAMVRKSDKFCPAISKQPLLQGEMPRKTLPAYHLSEITLTVASFRHVGTNGRKTAWYSNSNYYYGGVSPSGRELYKQARPEPTQFMQVLQAEAGVTPEREEWTGKSGNRYYSLIVADSDVQPFPSPRPSTGPRGLLDDDPQSPPKPQPQRKGLLD